MTIPATEDMLRIQLEALIDQGLAFGACVQAFAARRTEDELHYVALAQEECARDGQVEIDDNAIVSGSADAGDYVMAWVWVADPDADLEDEEDDEDDEEEEYMET